MPVIGFKPFEQNDFFFSLSLSFSHFNTAVSCSVLHFLWCPLYLAVLFISPGVLRISRYYLHLLVFSTSRGVIHISMCSSFLTVFSASYGVLHFLVLFISISVPPTSPILSLRISHLPSYISHLPSPISHLPFPTHPSIILTSPFHNSPSHIPTSWYYPANTRETGIWAMLSRLSL